MPTAQLAERMKDGKHEVELGLDEKLAFEEAKRCYLCNLRYEIDVDRCIFCRAASRWRRATASSWCAAWKINDDGAYGKLLETRSGTRSAPSGSTTTVHPLRPCYTACPVQASRSPLR
jgi:formate dehydrogenase major subunit